MPKSDGHIQFELLGKIAFQAPVPPKPYQQANILTNFVEDHTQHMRGRSLSSRKTDGLEPDCEACDLGTKCGKVWQLAVEAPYFVTREAPPLSESALADKPPEWNVPLLPAIGDAFVSEHRQRDISFDNGALLGAQV